MAESHSDGELRRTYLQLVNGKLDSLNSVLTGECNGVGVDRETLVCMLSLIEMIRRDMVTARIDIVNVATGRAVARHCNRKMLYNRTPGFAEFMDKLLSARGVAPGRRAPQRRKGSRR